MDEAFHAHSQSTYKTGCFQKRQPNLGFASTLIHGAGVLVIPIDNDIFIPVNRKPTAH
jgi:hypothetical protein